LILAWLGGVRARAEAPSESAPSSQASADELFARGKERLAAGDHAAACPLLAESYRLDPATGGLLALALCFERAERLASACDAYREVVTRSQAEARPDRERAARDKLAMLEPKLSHVTLDVSAVQSAPGLEVRLNGVVLAPEQFGKPLALDGGEILLEVSAVGREPWQSRASLAASAAQLNVSIPALSAPAAAVPAPAPPRAAPVLSARPVRHDEPASAPRHPAEWAGIGILTAGGVSLVTSIGFALRAAHQNDRADFECMDDVCTPTGDDARDAAQRARDAGTISALVGVGLSVFGVVSYVVGRQRRGKQRHLRAEAAGWAAPGSIGGTLRGSF
jgi:hypothetical protein